MPLEAFKSIFGAVILFFTAVSLFYSLFNPPIVRHQLISTLGSEQGVLVHHGLYLKHLPEW